MLIPVSAYAMIGLFGAALALAELHWPDAAALGTGLIQSLIGLLASA